MTMKSFYPMVGLLMLSACGPSDVVQDIDIFHGVDPRIQVYFTRFESKTGVGTYGITAGFTTLNGLAGECVQNGMQREVRIDSSYWTQINYDDSQMEQLIFHELGHCALGLGHIPTYVISLRFNSYIQGSIMNPYAFGPTTWYAYYESYYVDALIHNTTIPNNLN
jgi:hypothetical protein